MNTDASTFCYIGIWPACQCIRFVSVDAPECAKDNATDIARLVRKGYSVERMPVSAFRVISERFGCKDKAACPNPHTALARKRKAA